MLCRISLFFLLILSFSSCSLILAQQTDELQTMDKANNNQISSLPSWMSSSTIPQFHNMVTGALLGVTIIGGILVNVLSRYYGTSTLYYYLFTRKWILTPSEAINDVVSLTFGEIFVWFMYFVSATCFFMFGLIFEFRPHSLLCKTALAFGYICVLNMALILLPCTRHSVWTWLFNVSYERAVKFHRYLGVSTFFCVMVHGILFACHFYVRTGGGLLDGIDGLKRLLVWGTRGVNNLAGLLSGVAMICLVVTALPWVRRYSWVSFKVCHMVFMTLMFVFGHLHLPKLLWPFTAASMAMYVLDLLVQYTSLIGNRTLLAPWKHNLFSSVKRCQLQAHEDGIVTAKLTLERCAVYRDPEANAKLLNGDPLLQLEEEIQEMCLGKYIYLWVWEISIWESHPFSISSVSMPDMDTIEVNLIIKEANRDTASWTSRLYRHACQYDGSVDVTARFDGPFGSLTIPIGHKAGPCQYDLILLFAGGVGVTPFNALTQYCANRNHNTILTWTVRNTNHVDWVPELMTRYCNNVKVWVTKGTIEPSAGNKPVNFHAGRPDFEQVVSGYLKEKLTINESPLISRQCKNVAVAVCGPSSMCMNVLKACKRIESGGYGEGGVRFHIHTEAFDL